MGPESNRTGVLIRGGKDTKGAVLVYLLGDTVRINVTHRINSSYKRKKKMLPKRQRKGQGRNGVGGGIPHD